MKLVWLSFIIIIAIIIKILFCHHSGHQSVKAVPKKKGSSVSSIFDVQVDISIEEENEKSNNCYYNCL
jgi:hypothetical protein